jgi:hypothetical protein
MTNRYLMKPNSRAGALFRISEHSVPQRKRCEPCAPSASSDTGVHRMLTKTTDGVDFRKLLRDVLRGAIVEADLIPVPVGNSLPLIDADENGELVDPLTEQEWRAYLELVREMKAEAIAAGDNRLLTDFDTVIAECEDLAGQI